MVNPSRAVIIVGMVTALLLVANAASAQIHEHGGQWHNHPQNHYHYHGYGGSIGYQPNVTWYPDGIYFGVGPVTVSPNRRYVRFGINANFYNYRGHSTYNLRTGQSRYYGR